METKCGWQQVVGGLLVIITVVVGIVTRLNDPSMTNWEFITQYPWRFVGLGIACGTGTFLMVQKKS
jgi:hypothetical protein